MLNECLLSPANPGSASFLYSSEGSPLEPSRVVEVNHERIGTAWRNFFGWSDEHPLRRRLFWVALSDGRVIGVPLAWFLRLLRASREQPEACRISNRGLHWEALGRRHLRERSARRLR